MKFALFLLGLLGGTVGTEVVGDALLSHLQSAAAASAGSAALDGLDGPVEATGRGARIGAGTATLPLLVEGVLTAATAKDVSASVTSTLRGSTLGHFVVLCILFFGRVVENTCCFFLLIWIGVCFLKNRKFFVANCFFFLVCVCVFFLGRNIKKRRDFEQDIFVFFFGVFFFFLYKSRRQIIKDFC